MHCIASENNDPYFNLASEEYLLKERPENFFLFYRNTPCIVIGKHQNAMAEINHAFIREKQIRVARRISGGGTVYHDPGNLNFTFINSGEEGKLVDYGKYIRPMIEAMGTMGLKVRPGKRHELLLGNKKISGTASHVFKKRVLHHGTLLFSSDLETLGNALRTGEGLYEDRAVRSVRSEVTNIRDHLPDEMDILDFQDRILDHILHTVKGAVTCIYTREDLQRIHVLRETKFSTLEWNFGHAPGYRFSRKIRLGTGEIIFHMFVEKGIIREFRMEGDPAGINRILHLEETLVGTFHEPESIRRKLSGMFAAGNPKGLTNDALIEALC